jgi:hypothetical protein
MRFLKGEYVNSSLVARTTEELGIRTKINTAKRFVFLVIIVVLEFVI